MTDVGGVATIVLGIATLILSILTAVGAARANSERRPAQRAEDAVQLLRHLDAVDDLDDEPKALNAPDGIAAVRRELVGVVRQNAAVYAMRQRESIWGSFVRTLLLVEGAFVIVFGGYLPLLYPGQEQSVTLSIVFLISGIVLAFSGTVLGYRHHRFQAARRLAGTDPPTFWAQVQDLRRVVRNRRAVRRSRSRR
ncbi:hypothetical protein [Curtobacterium sp. MCPF17_021]|uniref:hypothetical protein n=1 Tax=Curtobacterium sp. MCPF17_021 TaxID=2175639 RepID=UPI000DA96866|nr:hypothetical protein [Curtobacterium sp. MCPF17_021]WIE85142.1 hypothetical protein DEJ29_018120 [Curtobacterium sp. MCPF17_021]